MSRDVGVPLTTFGARPKLADAGRLLVIRRLVTASTDSLDLAVVNLHLQGVCHLCNVSLFR